MRVVITILSVLFVLTLLIVIFGWKVLLFLFGVIILGIVGLALLGRSKGVQKRAAILHHRLGLETDTTNTKRIINQPRNKPPNTRRVAVSKGSVRRKTSPSTHESIEKPYVWLQDIYKYRCEYCHKSGKYQYYKTTKGITRHIEDVHNQ